MGRSVLRAAAAGVLGALAMLPGGTGMACGQTVSAVAQLDTERFTGTWYEVAELPTKWEKRCVRDPLLLIARGDKPRTLELVSACQTKLGNTDVHNEAGKEQDKSGDGKLKVRTIWPFSRKYWVLAVGPGYEWCLLGSPNHKELWVLSRRAVLPPAMLAELEAKAAAQGFPSAKLVRLPQKDR